MTVDLAWDNFLEPDEEILWSGKPGGQIIFSDALSFLTIFGIAISFFSLTWMVGTLVAVARPGAPILAYLFPLFALPFLLFGLQMAGGHILIDAYRRRRTWYTLTNKNAYIATSGLWKKSLDIYPVEEMNVLRIEPGALGTVIFKEHRSRKRTAIKRPSGFYQISDALLVFNLLRELRCKKAQNATKAD